MKTITLDWTGPFELGERATKPAFQTRGIYLFTVEYKPSIGSAEGRPKYLVHFAGITNKTFKDRIGQNIALLRNGSYYILKSSDLQIGIRTVLWEWHYKKMDAPAKATFLSRQTELNPAIELQLSSYRVFLAPLMEHSRILERIEAAVMNCVYEENSPSPIADVGMHLIPIRANEDPLKIISKSIGVFGLPEIFTA